MFIVEGLVVISTIQHYSKQFFFLEARLREPLIIKIHGAQDLMVLDRTITSMIKFLSRIQCWSWVFDCRVDLIDRRGPNDSRATVRSLLRQDLERYWVLNARCCLRV